MATISLCMIVKNEEDVLARCLSSVSPAVDEIIIVDTGSQDHTREIASTFTEKVYDFAWIDDFSAARNFSFSKATMDYCMWLDADDVVEATACDALIVLKQELTADVVMMPYHCGSLVFYRERLLRRQMDFRWVGAVHEAIIPRGSVIYREIAVTHRKEHVADPDRNLRIYEKCLAKGAFFSPRDRFYYARELTYHERDREAIPLLKDFLQEEAGWIEDRLEACRLLAECYHKIGEKKKAFATLTYGFTLDIPRPELCCDLGDLFMESGAYQSAVYWYQAAFDCPRDQGLGGFTKTDCRGIYPALQLCVCFWHLGEHDLSKAWNETAASFAKDHPAVRQNDAFFAKNKSHDGA